MNCSACTKPNADGVSFCEFCGADLRPRSIPNSNSGGAQTSPSHLADVNMALDLSPRSGLQANGPILEVRAEKAMARYRDGYLHARTINGFGATIKVIALIIGGLLALVAFRSLVDTGLNGTVAIRGLAIMLTSLLISGIGYILGVLVQSIGQSMKAQFDCAVNGSHFLDDDQRARVMSLE